jgi:signal transduction histidine kinase
VRFEGGVGVHCWPHMSSGHRNGTELSLTLAAQLHDVAAGLAVGVGQLKASKQSGDENRPSDLRSVTEALEVVLADLKSLTRSVAERPKPHLATDWVASVMREARRVGVTLELDVVGPTDWLAADQAELLYLTAREAIRNVKRHSGSATCRMTIEVSDCPFVLRARDWGGGIKPESRPGEGVLILKELATSMGCDLVIGSQPGLGTELILAGRRCPTTRDRKLERTN